MEPKMIIRPAAILGLTLVIFGVSGCGGRPTRAPAKKTFSSTQVTCVSNTPIKANGMPYQSDIEIQQEIMKLTTPAPSEMVFYRWGHSDFENARIGANPIFDIDTVNAGGGEVGGRGLYVAEDPVDSASFGLSAGSKATLITVIVPAGTPLLDAKTNHQTGLNPGAAKLASIGLDRAAAEACDPPLLLKYDLGDYWVFKVAGHAGNPFRVEPYTGKYIESEKLIGYQASLELNYSSLHQQVHPSVEPTLKLRPHYHAKSGIQEPIPTPPKSIHLTSNWYSIPELQSETPPNSPLEYRWTWGGTCNGYYQDQQGHYVLGELDAHTDQCEMVEKTGKVFVANSGVPTTLFPSSSVNSGSGICYRVIQSDRRVRIGKTADTQATCN
jgi:hypothetical protein